MFTFVISARNEEENIATIVRQACAAARPGDGVLVVDSASSDTTARRAVAAGAEVLRGPRGKEAAMAAAIAGNTSPWLCFLDADLVSSDVNVPATLRQAAVSGTADHIVRDYEYADVGTILSSMFTIYEPLVAEFFPEVGALGANALTGYRAIRRRFLGGVLPTHLGVESHLNISIALAGGIAAVCQPGVIASRFRYKPDMCREIAGSPLDLAVDHDRLDPGDRADLEQLGRWGAAAIAAATATATAGRSAALARLFAAARRPMPSRASRASLPAAPEPAPA